MPVHAMLVSPPLVKSLGQPSLGMAMLVGAGQAAGHTVQSLDLSARWLHHVLGEGTAQPAPGPFLGDHDRHSHLTRPAQQTWLSGLLPGPETHRSWTDGLTMRMDHDTALRLAREGLRRPAGQWLVAELRRHEEQHGRPAVVGVSVMFAGQVLAALALTSWVREHWPAARVVWGGPHVTALQPEILADARYAAAGVDAVVFGYAEQTWVDILDAVDAGSPLPPEAVSAGPPRSLVVRPGSALRLAAPDPQSLRSTAPPRARDNAAVRPVYQELESHRFGRLTLPVQLSRGCAYGRCAQCTYPWVEGGYRPLPLASTLEHAVQMAIQNKAVLALKDALVVPSRLQTKRPTVSPGWRACWRPGPRWSPRSSSTPSRWSAGPPSPRLRTSTASASPRTGRGHPCWAGSKPPCNRRSEAPHSPLQYGKNRSRRSRPCCASSVATGRPFWRPATAVSTSLSPVKTACSRA